MIRVCWLVLFLVLSSPLVRAAPAKSRGTGVWVNRVELSRGALARLERRHGVTMTPGRHWYDPMTGAWGFVGGPAAGFIRPGLALGGPLWEEASGGGTGVVVNGRELHPLDVVALRAWGIPVRRGRWWLNALGVGGYEGGPPLFDLKRLARPRRRSPAGRGRRKSAFSTWDLTGVAVY